MTYSGGKGSCFVACEGWTIEGGARGAGRVRGGVVVCMGWGVCAGAGRVALLETLAERMMIAPL